MSDKFYAVQFQNMQDDTHSIVVLSTERLAKKVFEIIREYAHLPCDLFYTEKEYVDIIDIDFPSPPTHYRGIELMYVNDPVSDFPNVIC